jgi:ribA/ribD-fused uncharacterized protein
VIERFRGDFFFLSNMQPLDHWIETDQGFLVSTAEHAYQAAKFLDPTVHQRVSEAYDVSLVKKAWSDGVASKELAHRFIEEGTAMRHDWEVAKQAIMLVIVRQKFLRNSDLAEKLVMTAGQDISEGNNWGDRYWGVDPVGSTNGYNHLGKILMTVRTELLNESGATL